jgi:hypothetical protein
MIMEKLHKDISTDIATLIFTGSSFLSISLMRVRVADGDIREGAPSRCPCVPCDLILNGNAAAILRLWSSFSPETPTFCDVKAKIEQLPLVIIWFLSIVRRTLMVLGGAFPSYPPPPPPTEDDKERFAKNKKRMVTALLVGLGLAGTAFVVWLHSRYSFAFQKIRCRTFC